MENRGRKRNKHNPNIPAHIAQDKLPDNCYWDNSGRGRWFTTYRDETGRQRTKRIAGRDATLSQLHKLIEEYNGIDPNTFNWLTGKFQASTDFKQLEKGTRKDYQYCSNIIAKHPTKKQILLGAVGLSQWSRPMVRKLMDQIIEVRGPSAANHALRYLRRLLGWGLERGYVNENYAQGIKQAKEKPKQHYVDNDAYMKMLAYAKECGARTVNAKDSCPEYIWAVMEIAYLCRMRGIEIVNMNESHYTELGALCQRRKGSRTNIAAWNDRLKAAWNALITRRNKIWAKKKMPVPVKPEDRPLVVTKTGAILKKSSLETAWQRLITRALEGENPIITQEQRFSLHDLKRKGITDTQGTRADKQDAAGHRSQRMMDVYDKSIPVVKPSGE
ncbi:site-specific integrase [Methylophaga sp. OBS4]|uniref:site-specific integrase n=1 Tax=Methylophaga sp. OBS4 TaxID=2991935 RepID=UPI002254C190|nr:hypothetical protein [Methylophaga sp. OBS4]MCX4186728.1 hypothetical protein [Methylophaga sp. OBS4]